MLDTIKQILIGTPLPTGQLAEKRLNKIRALAAFSPDALSSIAYANQEIFLGLVAAGAAGLVLSWPIGVAITIVLFIASLSYYQTIQAYPSGGGSYIVARENLGTIPGLVAAAALLIDYVLVAAVSLTAGVEAIASALPFLWDYRVQIALFLLIVITIINLRGVEESGTAMSIPVYLFLFTYLPMLAIGMVKLAIQGPVSMSSVAPPAMQPLTLILVLHAFSAGCTALTGIEAISNGVPAFRPPESKNAGKTLIIMAILMAILFLGSIGLTQALGAIAGEEETILSALARRILGDGLGHLVIQVTTLLILTVAANTAFAGFPRVAAILAKDGFLPRQFTNLGDRLVFANGITVLAVATGLIIIAFRGDTHALVPLFAVGAFLAFTLSQGGMVLHWWREKGKQWQTKALLNGLGALATGITLLVVGVSKFLQGAWITVILIPLLVLMFLNIKNHYTGVAKQLTLHGLPPSLKPFPPLRVVIPISGVHRGIFNAVNFARSISQDITAVYVELEPARTEKTVKDWKEWWPDIPLVVLKSPFRSIVRPLIDYLVQTDDEINDGQLATIVMPEFVPVRWWHTFLHNQTSWLLKTVFLYQRNRKGLERVIIDVPYHLRK